MTTLISYGILQNSKKICINADDVSQKVPPLISFDEIKIFQTISYYSILFPKKCKRSDERNDDIMIYRYSVYKTKTGRSNVSQ